MARRSPPRKVTYFEPVPPRLAHNTIIESTFEGWPSLRARERGLYPHDFVSVSDHLGSIRRVGLQNN
jgi:hypothetical protein